MTPSRERPQGRTEAGDDAALREGRLDDLQVHAELISTSEELKSKSERCWSLCSSQCLSASYLFVRRMASILHDRTFV